MVPHSPERRSPSSPTVPFPPAAFASFPPHDTLGGGKVPLVHSTPRHQHVTAGAKFMGEVSLLQYDHSISYMPVETFYPHYHHHCRASCKSLHQAVLWSPRGWEGHRVSLWFLDRGRGCLTPYLIRCPTMLRLQIFCQKPNHNLLPAILALEPSPPTLPVLRALSPHLSTVRCLNFFPAAWHSRKTMPTVFPTLVRKSTLSNSPVKLLKPPWSHRGSDNETMPSSA